jgi:hypothetical protein
MGVGLAHGLGSWANHKVRLPSPPGGTTVLQPVSTCWHGASGFWATGRSCGASPGSAVVVGSWLRDGTYWLDYDMGGYYLRHWGRRHEER